MNTEISFGNILGDQDYLNTAIEFNNYISEHEDLISLLLTDDKNYYLAASTFSGKTYSIMDIAYRNNIKIVLAVPLQIIAKQKSYEYSQKHPNQFIFYLMAHDQNDDTPWRSTSEYILNQPKRDVIISVYNSVEKLINHSKFNSKEYVLVIDECHNLVTQYDFRHQVINYLDDHKASFKKVVYMTGTLEGTRVYNYDIVAFKKMIKRNILNKYYILTVEENGIYYLANLLMQNVSDRISFILIDNSKTLENLKNALITLKNDLRIAVITADDKKDDSFALMIQEQILYNNYDVILTTRVIAEGVNILDKNADIFFYNVKDPLLKRQYIGRIRNGANIIFDIIVKDNGFIEGIINASIPLREKIKAEYLLLKDRALQELSFYSKNRKISKYSVDELENLKKTLEYIYIDSNHNYKISLFKLEKKILDFSISELNSNLKNLQEFLKSYYDIDSEIFTTKAFYESQKIETRISLTEFNRVYNNSEIGFNESKLEIQRYLKSVIEKYKANSNNQAINDSEYLLHQSLKTGGDVITEKLYKRLMTGNIRKLVKHLFKFARFKYPKSFLEYVLSVANKKSYSNIKRLEICLNTYFIYKIVRTNNAQFNNLADISLNENIKIVKVLHNHFQTKDFEITKAYELLIANKTLMTNEFGKFKSVIINVLFSMYDFSKNGSQKLYNDSIRDYKGVCKINNLTGLINFLKIENQAVVNVLLSEEEEISRAYNYILTGMLK